MNNVDMRIEEIKYSLLHCGLTTDEAARLRDEGVRLVRDSRGNTSLDELYLDVLALDHGVGDDLANAIIANICSIVDEVFSGDSEPTDELGKMVAERKRKQCVEIVERHRCFNEYLSDRMPSAFSRYSSSGGSSRRRS